MPRRGSSHHSGVMATTPRRAVSTLAQAPWLARGSDERFTGYGAMGVPYSGGHYLAFRDMLASSFGKPYRAIWHRDPQGRWTIFTNYRSGRELSPLFRLGRLPWSRFLPSR